MADAKVGFFTALPGEFLEMVSAEAPNKKACETRH